MVKVKKVVRNRYHVSKEEQRIIERVYTGLATEFESWAQEIGEEVSVPKYYWTLSHLNPNEWHLHTWIIFRWHFLFREGRLKLRINVYREDKMQQAIQLAKILEINSPNWLPRGVQIFDDEVELVTYT